MKRMLIPILCLTGLVRAEVLTLPLDHRPAWLSREGIVMAGSWEPLLFRVRRDGGDVCFFHRLCTPNGGL